MLRQEILKEQLKADAAFVKLDPLHTIQILGHQREGLQDHLHLIDDLLEQ